MLLTPLKLRVSDAKEEDGDIAVMNGYVIIENDAMAFVFPDCSVEDMEVFFIGYG